MSESSVRAGRSTSGPTRSGRPLRGLVGAAVGTAVLVAAAACGFNAQSLKPYTPSEGVNTSVGNSSKGSVTNIIEVRNLMILSRTAGEGFLSASLLTQGSDTLTGVTGYVIKTDGSQGSALTVTLASPIEVANNQLVVLTDQTEIPVTSSDLLAGGTANVTLTFANAGSKQIVVTVIDANFPPYNSVSPSPAPSSASPSS